MADSKHQMDMCNGPLFRKIIIYALPLIATSMLQQLFSAADLIVVGRYAPYQDMAAVGSCLPICSLIINIFFGISVGAGVLTANGIGARDRTLTSRAIHTAITVAGVGGLALTFIGLLITPWLLQLMDTPPDVMPKAASYMRIYCIGLPAWSLYAYGGSLLRAMGDTKRPLYYLIFAGIINVIFNYILVVFFSMGVNGVAIATMISFIISAVLVLRALMNMPGSLKLKKNLLKVDFKIFRQMLWIGVPAGVQGSFFSIANFVLQGAINSFGSAAMAGNAAAINIEAILYSACFSFNQAATSFAGQNFGAKKYDRVIKSNKYCVLTSGISVGIFGLFCSCFGRELISIYNSDPTVIDWGIQRVNVVYTCYAFCAVMDSICGTLRGIGRSVVPMMITLFGVCALRIAWVWWVFPLHPTLGMLMGSYPVSWAFNALLTGIYLYFIFKKFNHPEKSSGYSTVPR